MDEMSMCANFFWNRSSRLGGDSEQTDRQKDRQTNNGIYNIDVYTKMTIALHKVSPYVFHTEKLPNLTLCFGSITFAGVLRSFS